MGSRGIIFGGIIVMVGLAGFLLMSTTSVSPTGKVRLGQTPTAAAACREDDCFPDFTATTLDGQPIKAAELRGKVVLVNHWATWCGPCVKEMPALESVYRQFRDKDFVILGLAGDDPRALDQVRTFVQQKGVTFPIVPLDGEVERAFGRPAFIPMSTLYGADGHIKQVWRGSISEDDLIDALGRL